MLLTYKGVVFFIILYTLFGLYANENLHIHEQISDVTVGSDATSSLICAEFLIFSKFS